MTVKILRQAFGLIVTLILVVGAILHPVIAQDDELPEEIWYQFTNHYPEGIEWDAENEHFLVGSLSTGTILAVTDDGTTTPLVEFDEPISTVGLEIDEERGRLLVVISDSNIFTRPTETGVAKLGAYDLATGEELWVADLGALLPDDRHFANDVTVDPTTGTAYVTDSLAGVIYSVLEDGSPQVFYSGPELVGLPGANGIEFHPDGFLIVPNMSSSTLYKIALNPPADAALVPEPIVLDDGERSLSSDGLTFNEDGNLVVVGRLRDAQGASSFGAFLLGSDDEWATASLLGEFRTTDQPSTAAIRAGAIYIVFPNFPAMNLRQGSEEFLIQQVTFVAPTDGLTAPESDSDAEAEATEEPS